MNYKAVIEDFKSGLIDKNKFQLTMDNDGGYWSYIDDSIEDEDLREIEADKMSEMMTDKYGTPDGYSDLVDILQAAGVNAEWC